MELKVINIPKLWIVINDVLQTVINGSKWLKGKCNKQY